MDRRELLALIHLPHYMAADFGRYIVAGRLVVERTVAGIEIEGHLAVQKTERAVDWACTDFE